MPSSHILPKESQVDAAPDGGAVDGGDGDLGQFDHLLESKCWQLETLLDQQLGVASYLGLFVVVSSSLIVDIC